MVLACFTTFIYWGQLKHGKKTGKYVVASNTAENKFSELAIKMLMFSVVIQAVANKQADIFRVAFMFDIFAIALVPNAINLIKNVTTRKVAYWSMIAVIILRFYILILPAMPDFHPYAFFWETIDPMSRL